MQSIRLFRTFQFIFSPDGTSGTCYEHSPAEGIVLVQVIEKALESLEPPEGSRSRAAAGSEEKTEGRSRRSSQCCADGDQQHLTEEFPAPKRLTWKINDDVQKAIETATIELDRYTPSTISSLLLSEYNARGHLSVLSQE